MISHRPKYTQFVLFFEKSSAFVSPMRWLLPLFIVCPAFGADFNTSEYFGLESRYEYVYVYEFSHNKKQEFVKTQRRDQNDQKILVLDYFNEAGRIIRTIEMQVREYGLDWRYYQEYKQGKALANLTKVHTGAYFPFTMNLIRPARYHLDFGLSRFEGSKFVLRGERFFKGTVRVKTLVGEREAIRINEKIERHIMLKNDKLQGYTDHRVDYYARGLGLVRREYRYGSGISGTYRLIKRISVANFKAGR